MKFSLTKNTKDWFGTTLFQIKAEMSFGSVSKGDFWGRIEKESNLSQENNAWVYGDALVYDDARVYGDALVYGNALVSGKIKLELWQCFARKEKDRDVSEVENAWIILLIKDYKPAEEEVMEMTVADVEKLTGRKVKIIK